MKFIKCNLDGNTVVDAIPSRRKYTFTPDVKTIPIDETNSLAEGFVYREDVPDLVSKRRMYRACCGGNDSNLSIFEEV